MTIGENHSAAAYPPPCSPPLLDGAVVRLPVPAEVTWARWTWLIGSAGTVAAGGILMAANGVNVITEVVLVGRSWWRPLRSRPRRGCRPGSAGRGPCWSCSRR